MFGRVALLLLAIATIAANGIKFKTGQLNAALYQFDIIHPIYLARDGQTAVQHFRNLRRYSKYFVGAINDGAKQLFSIRFNALLAMKNVADIDRYLATFGSQQAELEVFVASQQAEWLQISGKRSALVAEFTGDAKLAAALNQLTAEQEELYRTQLLPLYHKKTVAVVQKYRERLAVVGVKPSDQEKLEADMRRVYWTLRTEYLEVNDGTSRKIKVLFAAFPEDEFDGQDE